jgi:sugar-specific transcriptional regulator TrmB
MVLAALGLDETCASVHRVLLTRPHADLAELRDRAGISDAELRRALDRLGEGALVRAPVDAPHRFRAVEPEIGVQVLIARQQERLAAEQHRVEQLRLAAHLSAEFSLVRRRGLAYVERLDGIEEVRDRIKVLVRDVKSEVMTFAPGRAQTAENMEAARPQARELLERGVQMRTVYLDSVHDSPVTCGNASWLAELGGEVRTVASLPTRLLIMDREVAIVPADGEDSGVGALILTGSGTLTALCALFESIWDKAVPFGVGSARDRDERGSTAQDVEVLRLLGQRLTDDVVAKRLGVSPRTARRIARWT